MNKKIMEKQQLWGVRETERAMEERDVHIGDEITAYIPYFDSVKAKSKRKNYVTKKLKVHGVYKHHVFLRDNIGNPYDYRWDEFYKVQKPGGIDGKEN